MTQPADAMPDREKWLAEQAFRDRELLLKEREQARLDDELHLKRQEARRSRWSSPLVIAILGAAAAALGNAGVTWVNGKAQRELENIRAVSAQKSQELNNISQLNLETFKAESARIFEVVKTSDPDKAAVNLRFLLDVGLVTNENTKVGLASYLKTRKSGQGFALPSAERSPLFNFSKQKTGLSADVKAQDEIAYMVKYLKGNIAKNGDTIKQALTGYTGPSKITKVVEIFRQHGYPDVDENAKINLDDRPFLKALIWSISHMEKDSDISEYDLDSGIEEAAKGSG
jgi:hypothetical protein